MSFASELGFFLGAGLIKVGAALPDPANIGRQAFATKLLLQSMGKGPLKRRDVTRALMGNIQGKHPERSTPGVWGVLRGKAKGPPIEFSQLGSPAGSNLQQMFDSVGQASSDWVKALHKNG